MKILLHCCFYRSGGWLMWFSSLSVWEEKKGGKNDQSLLFHPARAWRLIRRARYRCAFADCGRIVGGGKIVWDDDFKLWWCFFYAMLLTTWVSWFVVVLPAGVENFWVINCFFFLFYRSRWELATSSVVGCGWRSTSGNTNCNYGVLRCGQIKF